MTVHRTTSGVNTRILPAKPSSIKFTQAPNANANAIEESSSDSISLEHIQTCNVDISSEETLESLQAASFHLTSNLEPVALPTETVYGLGALALESDAVARVFEIKGRPADNPLIVHIASLDMLRRDVLPQEYEVPPLYRRLMAEFWPGPLTLLFPYQEAKEEGASTNGTDEGSQERKRGIPRIVTAGNSTVAVRMPAHPVARALIALTDAPIAAPSANTSGRPSPTRADHVFRDLGGKVGIILDDGGVSDVGVESTVVDGLHEDGNMRVLRPGGVTVEDLERVAQKESAASGNPAAKVLVHKRDYTDESQESAPTTPGMKYRHYSPTAPVVLLVQNHPSNAPSSSSVAATSAKESHPREDVRSIIESIVSRFSPSQNITIGLLLTSDSRLLAPLEEAIHSIGLVQPSQLPPASPQRRKRTLSPGAERPANLSSSPPNQPLSLFPRPLTTSLVAGDGSPSRISTQLHQLGSISEPQVTAQRLFDGLLTLDHDGVDIILVEAVEEKNEGLAVMNRIRKAAGETRWVKV